MEDIRYLRRSIVAPSITLLIALDSVFAGQFPFLVGGLPFNYIFSADYGNYRLYCIKAFRAITSKRYKPAICGLKASFLQMTLQFVFLPYNAWLMVHAAVLSLVRVLFTKRNMLEWVTALDAERGLKNSLKGYVIKMKRQHFRHWLLWFWLLHLKPVFRRQYPFFRLPCGFHRLL